ncbi:MAG: hypothetical protein P1V36_13740 [Planctomycetota bacterium]|nr:hypothetical protein [Planctomycetota bacterium]
MSSDSLYCRACDLIYDEYVAECPGCRGPVEEWKDEYLEHDPRKGSIKKGILVLCCAHVLQVFALFGNGSEMLMMAGFTQFLYVIPLMIGFALKGQSATVGGIAIGAGLSMVINVAAFGLMCASMLGGSY